ncbi:hypothetical protein BpHYR1_030153 [Brachionus plicatilis]|uniref:Uncharacterized protein n=1 Tax=Brachionus plicatilis TaxID=10195 RepID=A0A3M7P8K5_BRAPC|nr:hypothetical protein BpHYR1_030153 [Brachionus plicatilis]
MAYLIGAHDLFIVKLTSIERERLLSKLKETLLEQTQKFFCKKTTCKKLACSKPVNPKKIITFSVFLKIQFFFLTGYVIKQKDTLQSDGRPFIERVEIPLKHLLVILSPDCGQQLDKSTIAKHLKNVSLQLDNDIQRLVLYLIEAVLVDLGKIRKNPTSSYQKLATDFNSKIQEVMICKDLIEVFNRKYLACYNAKGGHFKY